MRCLFRLYLELEEEALQRVAYVIREAYIAGVRIACSEKEPTTLVGFVRGL